jgi:hypothetical protein
MENSIKNHIEIEGVVLTPEAIKELKYIQEHDNENLKFYLDLLAECACFIGSIFTHLNDSKEKEEAAQRMVDISTIREYLKHLKKP